MTNSIVGKRFWSFPLEKSTCHAAWEKKLRMLPPAISEINQSERWDNVIGRKWHIWLEVHQVQVFRRVLKKLISFSLCWDGRDGMENWNFVLNFHQCPRLCLIAEKHEENSSGKMTFLSIYSKSSRLLLGKRAENVLIKGRFCSDEKFECFWTVFSFPTIFLSSETILAPPSVV